MRIAVIALFAAVAAASGCANVKEINREPALSEVGTGLAQGTKADYLYPETPVQPIRRFSLWNDRQSRLFTDPRALQKGDILTVLISINDRARFKNESERNRTASRTLGLTAGWAWDGVSQDGTADGSVDSETDTQSTGATSRSENIELSVAAVVTKVLPNGNMVIQGSQEVRVNYELRILTIQGIVRPIDIGARNTVPYERIAEARISYGGRGRLSEIQQPPYGQQIIDTFSPF
jgi:flagellar L-ring protein precursor FlgH